MKILLWASVGMTLVFTLLMVTARQIGTAVNAPQVAIIHQPGAVHLLDTRFHALFPLVENLDVTPVSFHWSPDGRYLIYTLLDMNRYSIYMLDVLRGETLQIAERTLIISASAWSPDGRTLAMLSSQFDICLYSLDTRTTRCLGLQVANFPVWTPDGRHLVVNIAVGRDAGVYRVNPDTAAITHYTDLPPTAFPPVWSPDGQWMAFAVVPPDFSGDNQLYLAQGDSANPRQITTGEGQKTDLTWSPDSRRLIYTLETRRNRDLILIGLGSGESRPVADTIDTIEARPAWSPDGCLLAYVHYANGDLNLYMMDGQTLDADSARAVISILSYNFAWRP